MNRSSHNLSEKTLIYDFATLPAGKTTAVGGKGGTLARLYQRGYPVPAGFIITSEGFKDNSLREEAWQQALHHLNALRQGHGRTAFAVRSSALGEDSAHVSFAGAFESVLGAASDNTILQAIHTVYRSRENERVQTYSQTQGQDDRHQMAVIVQKLVPAEMAGVLFTADPVTGSHTNMMGNLVHGLGDQLVGGEVTPDSFTLSRPDGSYAGPGAFKRYGRTLFKLAQKLENELGAPQDIEWAVAGRRLYLLQARPITTMQPYQPATGIWNDSRRGDYLWTNANFGEAVPDVMTPLTWSLLQLYGQESFTIPLPGHHPLFGNIGGRFYMNITLAASMFAALGYSRARLQAQMQEFFGRLPSGVQIPLIPFSRWAVIHAFLKSAPGTIRRVRRNRQNLAAFTTAVPGQANRFQQQIRAAQTPAALLVVWAELLPYYRQACQMLHAGTGLFEDLVRPLRRNLTTWVGEAEANTLLTGFHQQGNFLASLGPLLGLWQVQQEQISHQDYQQQYGHRGPHEFELSWPRPMEDPAWISQQAAHLAHVDVPALLAKQAAKKAAAWARFRQAHPRRAQKVRARLEKVTAAALGREAIRSEIVRLVAVVRTYALQAGQVTGLGEDVFFLRLEELADRLRGVDTAVAHIPIRKQAYKRLVALPPYPAMINGRFDPFQWAQTPHRQHDIADAHAAHTTALPDQPDLIAGFPGAAGVVTGSVRRLDSPEEGHLLQPGEILVTATTNVGWTPLFPKAAAIITDVGAPLSHAAIVARELGIPAVVGTGNATMRLQTGDQVQVNGTKGTVKIC